MTHKPFTCLLAAAIGLALCTPLPATAADVPSAHAQPVPMLHATDLFRPHNDPDDHWDLASVYALAWQGRVDLCGILIDYPKPKSERDPDVQAVAQMNYLTGLAVPVIVGAPRWVDPPGSAASGSAATGSAATGSAASGSAASGSAASGSSVSGSSVSGNEADLRGVRALLDMLRRAPEPAVINILGSCRDVALAGRLEPDLFRRKCRAIYLNAGSGTPDQAKATQLEWNVRLEPAAYAAIFDLPCPIYWLPCFEEIRRKPRDLFRVAEYGTFYRFRQGDVLPHLSAGTQRYFATLFRNGPQASEKPNAVCLQTDWLQSLQTAPDAKRMERIRAMDRNMWCTGGFLHAAGWTVTRGGQIETLAKAANPVFTFDPIEVSCSKAGVTHWQPATAATNRYLFHVQDVDRYQDAMTRALRTLLSYLP